MNAIKQKTENNINHFAMIENFVEKYLPVRIQNQITDIMKTILPIEMKSKYLKFEKKKSLELNQIILDDDGIPDIVKHLKSIRMDV